MLLRTVPTVVSRLKQKGNEVYIVRKSFVSRLPSLWPSLSSREVGRGHRTDVEKTREEHNRQQVASSLSTYIEQVGVNHIETKLKLSNQLPDPSPKLSVLSIREVCVKPANCFRSV